MCSREGHMTKENGQVPRKEAWGRPHMCPFVTSNTLKSHNSVRIPDASGHTERKAEQVEVGNPTLSPQPQQFPDLLTPHSLVFLLHCQVSLASKGTGKLSKGVKKRTKAEAMDLFG